MMPNRYSYKRKKNKAKTKKLKEEVFVGCFVHFYALLA